MKARATAFGHAIHPMLIVFPLGLFATAVVFDIIHLVSGNPDLNVAAAYAIAAGIVGSAAAALFGWIDWFGIESGTRAKRVGLLHGLGNGVVALAFLFSWLVRFNAVEWRPDALAVTLGFAGAALAIVTAWLGGELVERLGIGVDENAQPNAPSSLSRPAPHIGK